MPVQVTAFYAALLGLLGLVLQGMVGRMRGQTKISLLHGNRRELIEPIRRHGNWVENVPFVLLLLAIVELDGAPKLWLHLLGVTLVLARLIHPFGISTERINTPQRIVGAGVTGIVALAAIATIFWQLFARSA